jgi:NTE family protein
VSGTPTIGLALGSGSARGWAHLGVLEAIEELGIELSCVAGCSIGALVGGVHAAGGGEALRELVLGLDWKELLRVVDPVLPRSGLLDGRKVAAALAELIPAREIAELPLPFRALATDLFTGDEVQLGEGDLLEAVRASISVPGLFTPVERDGRTLVDGGLANPVPVSVAREMGAEFVIAVDINHYNVEAQAPAARPSPLLVKALATLDREPSGRPAYPILHGLDQALARLRAAAKPRLEQWVDEQSAPRLYEVLLTSLNIMEARIGATRLSAEPADLLLRPRVGAIRFHEYQRGEEAMAEGYREAMTKLAPLREQGRI